MSKSKTTSGGAGLLSLLQVAFIVMKLVPVGSVGTWSWWWVLSPTLIPLTFVLILIVLLGIITLTK